MIGSIPNWALVLTVTLLAVAIRGDRGWTPLLVIQILVSFALAMGLKSVVRIPQPGDSPDLPWVRGSCSFPSAHTAVAFSVLPTLTHLYSWGVWPFTALAP